MQTVMVGQDDAAQDYLADRVRDAMQAGMGGIVVTADSRLIHASVQAWKEWKRTWNQIHWADLDYGASFGFPMNVMQTPKALLDTWASLRLPGYAEFRKAAWWYAHREETATVFDLHDYILLRRVKENRQSVSWPELIVDEALSWFTPLKVQLGQQDNRLDMRRWLEERHWVFFDVSQLEPKLRAFVAEYIAILFENETESRGVFVVNGMEPSARMRRFEPLLVAVSHVEGLGDWLQEKSERILTLFATNAQEAKRLNDLGIVSAKTDTASFKAREFIQVSRTGQRRSFVSQRADSSVSASLKHQIQQKDGLPRERILSLLREGQGVW